MQGKSYRQIVEEHIGKRQGEVGRHYLMSAPQHLMCFLVTEKFSTLGLSTRWLFMRYLSKDFRCEPPPVNSLVQETFSPEEYFSENCTIPLDRLEADLAEVEPFAGKPDFVAEAIEFYELCFEIFQESLATIIAELQPIVPADTGKKLQWNPAPLRPFRSQTAPRPIAVARSRC